MNKWFIFCFVIIVGCSSSTVKSGELLNGVVIYKNVNDSTIIDSVIYYKKNKVIVNLDKSDFFLKEELLFDEVKFSIPENWNRDDFGKLRVTFNKIKCDSSITFSPVFSIEKHVLNKNLSLDQITNVLLDEFRNNYGDLEMYNNKFAKIDRFENVKLVNFSMRVNEQKLGVLLVVYLNSDGSFYIFNGMGLNNRQNQIIESMAVFEEVVWSANYK